jgi:hypothetical protein
MKVDDGRRVVLGFEPPGELSQLLPERVQGARGSWGEDRSSWRPPKGVDGEPHATRKAYELCGAQVLRHGYAGRERPVTPGRRRCCVVMRCPAKITTGAPRRAELVQ